ncbi:hypothetical protein DVH24_035424 [Malus domestica]|uniref:Uncharacterized protein n=1 Tax=Malus domestica TaxID=3750 RepID=A0A498J585_MALDO|nr:hypothetical protein DVH24_035424 [Malus domestica]
MKERSREMGSSPPTAEEIFRDYCAPRTDAAPQPLKDWVSKGGVLLQYSSFGFSSDFTIVNWAASATVLSEYRVTKSDLELALIQFANDISSEAHVES